MCNKNLQNNWHEAAFPIESKKCRIILNSERHKQSVLGLFHSLDSYISEVYYTKDAILTLAKQKLDSMAV